MDNKEFELIPVFDKDTGVYTIKDFDGCKDIVQKFLEDCYLDIVISSEEDFKTVRATRTDIRKKKETVSTARKQITEMLIGKFEGQLKEIETMLGQADLALKEKVDEWEREHKSKVQKPLIITLSVKGYDMKQIEKVKDFALKQGLEVSIK